MAKYAFRVESACSSVFFSLVQQEVYAARKHNSLFKFMKKYPANITEQGLRKNADGVCGVVFRLQVVLVGEKEGGGGFGWSICIKKKMPRHTHTTAAFFTQGERQI